MSGLLSVAMEEPIFCWKNPNNPGRIPGRKDCDDGYKNVAGVCWQGCNKGDTDTGALCTGCHDCGCKWKGWKLRCGSCKCKTYAKKSYVTGQECNHENEYLYLGLCQWDCRKIGMVNCGVSACAADSDSCANEVIGIVTDVIEGTTDFMMFIGSLGASSITAVKGSA